MKKILTQTLTLLAGAALLISCAREVLLTDSSSNGGTQPSAVQTTFTANLEALLPKISFNPTYTALKPVSMEMVWAEGDVLRVYNHADKTQYSDFTLVDGVGTASATFSGTLPAGSSYDVEILDGTGFMPSSPNPTYTMAEDGSTAGLKYFASKENVSNLEGLSFDSFSSVLALTAKMPSTGVAGTITSVEVTASSNIFFGGNGATINITTPGDAGGDGVLHLFGSLPQGSSSVPAGTTMVVKFYSNDASHSVYTRFVEFKAAQTFAPNKINTVNVNASGSDSFANDPNLSGIGTSANPYLIGDGYQLAAVNSLATGGQTTYFKMIDDVDMTGITHNQINTNSGYTQFVNFDGNYKTVGNLGKNLFYVFKGSIQNLTLSGSSVGTSRGIFAEYCQGTGHTITNVDITGSSMASTSDNCGALIGRINSGSTGVTTVTITDCDITSTTVGGAKQTGGLIGNDEVQTVIANCTVYDSPVTTTGVNSGGLVGHTGGLVTITDCTVSGTNVSGTGVVGGVVGFAESQVTISGCKYTGGTLTASARYIGGFLGSTKDVASVIKDCQVEDATINVNYTDDPRGGGFVGQLQTSCRVEGCTVGTPSAKVTINSKQPKRNGSGTTEDPYVYAKINVGGFVGVNYGTITRNGGVRSKAYVKLATTNTIGTPLDLGGFVGFGRGTIEYCDAVVDMTNLKGQYIGGFAGYVINAGTVIDNCTVDGSVSGNNYTGGFVGYVDSGAPVISNCTASGSVTGQSGAGGFVGQTVSGVFTDCSTSATCTYTGTNSGGFVGQIHGGSMTGCSATGSVTDPDHGIIGGFAGLLPKSVTLTDCFASGDVSAAAGSYVAGFAGKVALEDAAGELNLIHCHASGNVSNSAGGSNGSFIGLISQGKAISIQRCYATGDLTTDKSRCSTFIGDINKSSADVALSVTIQDCYATGDIINSNQIRGGLIGVIDVADAVSVSNCYASGAIVGSFRLGGLIGTVNIANATVEHCAAWNSEISASNHGNANWSSGALVGTAFPTCTLTDNYRKPGISLLAFWGTATGYTYELQSNYQHPNVSSSAPLIICEKSTGTLRATTATSLASNQDNYPLFAYQGKVEAGKTLSQLASTTLGWSSDVWDFTGDLPTLK